MNTAPAKLAASLVFLLHCAPRVGPSGPAPAPPTEGMLLARADALRYLPDTAVAVVVARRARAGLAFVDAAGVDEFLPGLDFADPGAAATLGIATDRPVGVALLDLEAPTVVLFARIGDRKRLEAVFGDVAARADAAVERSRAGKGAIISAPTAGLGLVLRAGWAFAVISPVASKRESAEVALASIGAGYGLADEADFRRVLIGLRSGGDDLAGYVDPSAFASDDGRRGLRKLLSGWRGIAVSATFAHGAVQFGVAAAPDADHPITTLIAPADDEPLALFEHLTGTPGFAVAARMPVAAMLGAVDSTAANLLGFDVGSLKAQLQNLGGIDFDRDYVPLLSGELGVATFADRVDVVVGLRDRRRALAVIAPLARRLGLVATEPDTFELPGSARKVRVAVDAGSLRVSIGFLPAASEVGAAPVREGERNTTRKIDREVLKELRGAGGSAALHLSSRSMVGVFVEPNDIRARGRTLPRYGNEDVPPSQDYRALEAEFTAVSRQILGENRALDDLEAERLDALARPFGALTMTLKPASSLLVGRGRWQLEAGDLVGALARARAMDRDFARRRKRVYQSIDRLDRRLQALERELMRVRARDVQDWDQRH